MTDTFIHDHDPDEPVPPRFAVVAAFVDGEEVDGDALRHSLAEEDARSYLVDLMILRRSIVNMGPIRIAPGPSPARRDRRWWAAAAAMFVATAIGSFVLGAQRAGTPSAERSSAVEVLSGADVSRAPVPTEVIRLQPGVNWHQERK